MAHSVAMPQPPGQIPPEMSKLLAQQLDVIQQSLNLNKQITKYFDAELQGNRPLHNLLRASCCAQHTAGSTVPLDHIKVSSDEVLLEPLAEPLLGQQVSLSNDVTQKAPTNICGVCGNKFVDDTAVFCRKCGTAREMPGGPKKVPATLCPCGNRFLDDALFCRKCGKPRGEKDASWGIGGWGKYQSRSSK